MSDGGGRRIDEIYIYVYIYTRSPRVTIANSTSNSVSTPPNPPQTPPPPPPLTPSKRTRVREREIPTLFRLSPSHTLILPYSTCTSDFRCVSGARAHKHTLSARASSRICRTTSLRARAHERHTLGSALVELFLDACGSKLAVFTRR